MSWDGSDRKSRLPADWERRRMRVLRRDAYRCQARDSTGALCGARGSDVDHVIRGDDHDEDNLQTLCRWHHSRKSSAEGNAARRPRLVREREPERHPGLL